MENPQDQNGDISKSQFEQQPNQKDRSEENRQSTQGGLDQAQSPAETGQADDRQSGQTETATEQRSNTDEAASPATDTGFVGAEGESDTSSELIEEDDPDFAKDGQGSIE